MSRGLSAAMIAALQNQVLRPVIFFEGVFSSGTLRLWSGLGDRVWNGATWTGAGTLMGVSPAEETTAVVASGWTVQLSGVPPELVSLAIADARQGLAGRLWVGLLDGAGAVIADPALASAGRLDVPEIADDAESCVISISYESRLVDLFRAREWRLTDETQRLLYPGDRGLEYVAGMQNRPIMWGNAAGSGGSAASAPATSSRAARADWASRNPSRNR